MILVEDAMGRHDVEMILGDPAPGHRRHPVEVVADDRVLGRRRRRLLEAFELAQRLLEGLLAHARRLDGGAHPLDLFLVVLALAELAPDRLELLTQHVLALRPAHLVLDLLLDLGLDLERLGLLRELVEDEPQPDADVVGLEDLLLAGDVELEVRGDEVGELRRIREIRDEDLELVGEPRALRDERTELLGDAPHEGRHLDRFRGLADVLDAPDRRAQVRIGPREALEADARDALHEQPVRVVRELQHLHDAQHGPDAVDVVDARRPLDVPLHRGADEQPIGAHEHLVDQPLRRRRIHQQRRQQIRKQHRVLEREDRKLVRKLGDLVDVVREPARDRDLGSAAPLFDRRLLFLFFVHRSSVPAQSSRTAGLMRAALFGLDRQGPARRAALGNPDLEESVLEPCADRIRVEGRMDHDLPLEGPERDLHLLQAIDRPGRRRPSHAAESDDRSRDVDPQILPTDARHLEAQDDLVARLEDVGRRLPAISAAQAVGELAVQLDQRMRTVLLRNPSSPA
jgi:hypothetical protein